MSEELELIERLLSGEKSAWDRFVGRYAAVIFAAVRRRLVPAGRADESEDVAQDVFVRLCARDFRLLRNYDPAKAKVTTWLTVVANSSAIDHLRRQKGHSVDLDSVPEQRLSVEPKIPERVKIPPDLLSPRQALVIEMLYRKEMDVSDVAATLDVDPQTVRSTHHKALTKLRAHFQAEEEAEKKAT